MAVFASGVAGIAALVTGGMAGAGDEQWDFRFGHVALDGQPIAAVWFQGELIVGGTFLAAGQNATANIARWDGQEWRPVGEGLSQDGLYGPVVGDLVAWENSLYASGRFTRSGKRPLPGLARWDGAQWRPVGVPPKDGVTGSWVFALAFASVVRQADCNLSRVLRPRFTFSKMSAADAVQMNGLGAALCASI